jgi:TolB-like protein
MATTTRKLAAIMFTDIVGYTALMGSDEDNAFEVLRKNREIHTKFISKFNGTLIKEMGDGMLISFDLASNAVRCAIDIQKSCTTEEIPLKIGIHEGEMVFEQNDVLGDGVNIASRIQEGTEQGCIMISGSVYRDIKNKATIQSVYLGERSFKNVDEPIKVYKVFCDETDFEIPIKTKSAEQIPEKKSIVVLPFDDLSPGKDNEYFSDGLIEEIITMLSQIHGLRVISRTSALMYKGKDKSVSTIGEELNVRHVLEGSVRKAGNSLKITAQLIDAQQDDHLWAKSYNGSLDDIFQIQESVSRSIVDSLEIQLLKKENKALANPVIEDARAYQYYLKARNEIFKFTEEGCKYAINYLKAAEDIIGDNIMLIGGLGYAYCNYANVTTKENSSYIKECRRYAEKAIQLYPEAYQGYFLTAFADLFESGGMVATYPSMKKAFEIAPQNPEILLWYPVFLIFLGKIEEAFSTLDKLIAVDPLSSTSYLVLAKAQLIAGDLGASFSSFKKCIQLNPLDPFRYLYAYALAYNYQNKEVDTLVNSLIRDTPSDNFSISLIKILQFALNNDEQGFKGILTPEFIVRCKQDCEFSWHVADCYAILGDNNEALNWLDQAVDGGFLNTQFFYNYDPFIKPLIKEKRFEEIMEKAKRIFDSIDG